MERIYLDKTAFMLCRDIHPGTDTRYLVIFKDTSLKTIRDLTGDHVKLLTEVQATISQFLKQQHPGTHSQFKTFFTLHARQRSQCKECGGASICQHARQRSTCKECGGGGICQHDRQRSRCKTCKADKDDSMPPDLEELDI